MTIAYHSYTNEWENATYIELIGKRKELIEYITAYENVIDFLYENATIK